MAGLLDVRNKWLFTSLLIAKGLMLLGMGAAMAKEDLVLCSPIKGRLLDNGVPVVGATIKRIVSWSKYPESRVDFAKTDDKGNYSFGAVHEHYKFSWLDGLFHQPSVMVSLRMTDGQNQTLLLVTGRNDYKKNSETGLPQIELVSDLKDQKASGVPHHFEVNSHLHSINLQEKKQ